MIFTNNTAWFEINIHSRLQELEEDPYRVELEDDPTKEQEEYFRRIRQEWMEPGSSE